MIRRALDLVRRHLPVVETDTRPVADTATAAPPAGSASIAPWLRLAPPVLAVLFAISFWKDHEGLLRILAVSGWIGFATNWLAITMLFRPRRRRPLLGWGLIPANKERIALSLAGAVSRNLVNPDLIRQRLKESGVLLTYLENLAEQTTGILGSPAFRSDLDRLILDEIGALVGSDEVRKQAVETLADALEEATTASRLENLAFKTYRKIRGERLNAIIDQAMRSIPEQVEPHLVHLHHWLDAIPLETRRHAGDIESHIIDSLHRVLSDMDLTALIRDTVRAYDESRLEHLIQDATSEQLKTIQYLGAVLGTFGGFLIWNPFWAIPAFVGAGLMIWILDRLIARWSAAHAAPDDANRPTSWRP